MFDLVLLIKTVGYLGLLAIIFAESGLFVGFFLPGDSLLFTAGFLASQGYLNLWGVMAVCAVGAIAGVNVGYAFGRRFGPKIFSRDDSLLFHKDHVTRAQKFYDRHGPKTIVLARFIPVVRTFVPILAGVGQMDYRTFLTYNILGGILWAIGLPLIGFYLGKTIPNVDRYLLPIIIVIIVVSVAPGIVHFVRDWRKTRQKRLA